MLRNLAVVYLNVHVEHHDVEFNVAGNDGSRADVRYPSLFQAPRELKLSALCLWL